MAMRDDCLSGVVLKSKFDGSFYCVSQKQKNGKVENLTCLSDTEAECQCGEENPPPSSSNRILYATGMIIFTFLI